MSSMTDGIWRIGEGKREDVAEAASSLDPRGYLYPRILPCMACRVSCHMYGRLMS